MLLNEKIHRDACTHGRASQDPRASRRACMASFPYTRAANVQQVPWPRLARLDSLPRRQPLRDTQL